MKTIVIGGHLSPALSVIEKLDNSKILYIGRKYALTDDKALSLEFRVCEALKVPFAEIKTAKFIRKNLFKTFFSLFNLPLGTRQSLKIIKNFKPDVILGFGGYVSVPMIFAAKLLKIPVVIHEQTLEAGVANKMLSRFASKICISWPTSRNFFPKSKTILTGNPIRSRLAAKGSAKEDIFRNSLPTIYVTGGSLGSHAINLFVEKNLEDLLRIANVIHQSGDAKKYSDYDKLLELKKTLPDELRENYLIMKFVSTEDLSDFYRQSDLVVSRSGINTITEFIYFRKPAFLIPLPFGQKNEQLKNALFYKELGLAEVVLQNQLTPEKFLSIIKKMLNNLSKYKGNNLKESLIKEDAAEQIVKVLRNVARKKSA
jgi:UDP-N-acetylglucosamine--N-acetylmuramyl-(pentapeptide) pyrophosphoryl-undecaprenol N-acetylglucosamine transferase